MGSGYADFLALFGPSLDGSTWEVITRRVACLPN
jgi:hypothetical protein